MKHFNLKIAAGIFAFSLFSISAFAQNNNWELGGNNGFPPNAVNTSNNILGTNINIPLRIATSGTPRLFVNTGAGYVGMGNTFGNGPGLMLPLDRLHLHEAFVPLYTRFTNNVTGSTFTDGFKIGIEPGGLARINQMENRSIAMLTNDAERMRIFHTCFCCRELAN